MQKINYWIIALLLVLVGLHLINIITINYSATRAMKIQNDSLKYEFSKVKNSVNQIDFNMKCQLLKLDSSIARSYQTIELLDNNISRVRVNLASLKLAGQESYYEVLSKEEKEKNKKTIYQEVLWEQK